MWYDPVVAGFLADRASRALTVLFFLGLEALTAVSRWYWLVFVAVFLLLVGGTVLTQRADVRLRGPHVLILPLVYIGSVLLFHLFVSQGLFQQLFIALATVGFFFLVARGIEWSFPTWNWFFTSGTFFLFAAGMYGLTFHLRFPVWATMALVGAVTFLLSIHVLGRAEISRSRRLFWSVLLTLIVSEFLGAFAFLPLSYLVVGGVLFIVFYIALHLLQRHLYGQLTTRMVGEYLALGLLAVGVVFGTAQWAIV